MTEKFVWMMYVTCPECGAKSIVETDAEFAVCDECGYTFDLEEDTEPHYYAEEDDETV
ncbi:MAG: hypothetical protein ABIH46_08340 [Chloroflexota bacterium]